MEIVGPHSSTATMRMLDFVRSNRLPFTWHDEVPADERERSAGAPAGRRGAAGALDRPGVARARASAASSRRARRSTCWSSVRGPAGLGAAVYGASEGLDTLVVESTALGGQAGSSRRIENYLGFPAGITGTELTSRAVTQARKFGARSATPYRAVALEPGNGRHVVRLEEDHEVAARAVLLATGAEYRRLACDDLAEYEGLSVFYAAGPPEAQLCGASRVGGRGRRQLGRPGRRVARSRRGARHVAAPPRGSARDDVGLPRARARALRRRRARPQRDRVRCTARTGASKR